MEAMSELVVVTGPPGAGKTTVSRVLSGMFEPSARVAGDEFFAFIDRGYIDPWTAAANVQNEVVIRAAAAAAGRLADGGYTVVYDGVVGPWFIDTFGRAAGLERLHYALLLPPEQLCLHRVQSRVGHGFTDLEAARHMYAEFAGAEIDRRHLVAHCDNPESVSAHIFQLVRDGSIAWSVE
jgi:energy-coupling factor transporter ATP-binding protein EcfA2